MFPGEHLDPLFIPKLMQDERKSKGSEVYLMELFPTHSHPLRRERGMILG